MRFSSIHECLLISERITQKLLIVILRSRKHVVCTYYSLTGMILSALQAYANHVYANCSIRAERIFTRHLATHSLVLSSLYCFLQYGLVADPSGFEKDPAFLGERVIKTARPVMVC